MKTCIKRMEPKPPLAYRYAKTTKDNKRGECRLCENRGAVSQKRLRVLGISSSQYTQMNNDQMGLCAICVEPDRYGKELSVDHCHATGRIRGLLCSACNPALGAFADDPQRLLSAATYLQRNYDSKPKVPGSN